MQSLLLAKSKPVESLKKALFRMEKDREYEGLLPAMGEEEFLSLSEQERAYELEDRHEIIGLAAMKDVSGADLGVKESGLSDLLFDLDHKGERVVFVRYIGIDPRFQKKGNGAILLSAALGKFPHCSFLALLQKEDDRAIHLFKKKGFYLVKELDSGAVYAKMYVQPGLCRNIRW